MKLLAVSSEVDFMKESKLYIKKEILEVFELLNIKDTSNNNQSKTTQGLYHFTICSALTPCQLSSNSNSKPLENKNA